MPIQIRKMTDEEFQYFYQLSVAYQAEELMKERPINREEALEAATEELAQMLPNGLHSEHHCLMTIEKTNPKETVGFIWTLHEITDGKKQSFLCDFLILEQKRRQGYATAALKMMEEDAVEAGCQESVLFVADRNYAAKELYRKCGYQFLRQLDHGMYMIKQLIP